MKILLVEPNYSNKYPPLGLMKIAKYHIDKEDEVFFVKGLNRDLAKKKWDRIYITSLFTFYWDKTVKTINYYINSVENQINIYLGGVLATIQYDEFRDLFPNITIIKGILDRPGMLGFDDNIIVDTLIPDYGILNETDIFDYKYPTSDSYISYTTRGCIRNCKFCVVREIEPEYKSYISIKNVVDQIKRNHGEKRNLLLMDNNILASKDFDKIIDEIKELGFYKGNKSYISKKTGIKMTSYVDFNQGIDARLLTEEKAKKISEIEIKPLRIAFDHADDEYVKLYKEKIELSANYGMKHLSNYVLYNLDDSPEDLYKRLDINIQLNESFQKDSKLKGTKIFSFPMRYSPLKGEISHGRKYIGKLWSWKYIRTVQCILNATHGVVGPKRSYFSRSFGKTIDDFRLLLMMPEEYIVYRADYEDSGLTSMWLEMYKRLLKKYSHKAILSYITNSYIDINDYHSAPKDIQAFLKHYKIKNGRFVEKGEEYNYNMEFDNSNFLDEMIV